MIHLDHFSGGFCCKIFPEMAAASADVKLGSFVRDVAICSTKKRCNSGDSNFRLFACCSLLLMDLVDFAKSVVTAEVGAADELGELEQGTEFRTIPRLDPDVSSI